MIILQKIERLKSELLALGSQEKLYQKLMEWGKQLPPFHLEWKKEENRVVGCQSAMYLHSCMEKGNVFFYAYSDALISAGLAALLISIYSGEPPDTILLTPPTFLEELGIPASLTPGRANGLASLFLRMKQEAVKYLLPNKP
jgi:cysteine desulfuration protein SufE